jgi:DNA-binding MarR family transcriptional regulator
MAARLFESQTIDMATGEVMSITTVTVRKLNERFTMCRTTQGLDWLKKFTNKELQMIMVLNEMENLQSKTVSLTPLIRKEIQEFFGISKTTLSGMLTAMEAKEFLVRLSNSDILLNPSYFYKGESKDVLARIKQFNITYEEIRKKASQKVDNQSKSAEKDEQSHG